MEGRSQSRVQAANGSGLAVSVNVSSRLSVNSRVLPVQQRNVAELQTKHVLHRL